MNQTAPLPFLLLLLLSPLFALAQGPVYETAGHFLARNELIRIAPGVLDSVYVGGQSNVLAPAVQEAYPLLAKFDPQGQLVWHKYLPVAFGRIGSVSGMDTDNLGGAVVGVSLQGCDYGVQEGFIAKYDAAGNVRWRNDYAAISQDTSYQFCFVKVLADGDIVATFDDWLMRLGPNGNLVSMQRMSMGKIHSIAETDNLELVLGCANGLVRVDGGGQVLFTNAVAQPVVAVAYLPLFLPGGGHTIYLSGGWLREADASLVAVDSMQLDSVTGPATAILRKRGGEFIVIGPTGAAVVSGTLQISHSLPHPIGGWQIRDGLVRDSTLFLAGHQANAYTLKTLHLNGTSFNPPTDAAIVNSRTANFAQQPGYVFTYDTWLTIENRGSVPLNDFVVHGVLSANGFCGNAFYDSAFVNLAIPPGDTLEIFLGTITDPVYLPTDPADYEVTFCTEAPEGRLDKDPGNDCHPLHLDGYYVGAMRRDAQAMEALLWPQPAEGELNVKLLGKGAEKLRAWSLTDLQGRAVQKGEMRAGLLKIQLESLPAGLYFFETGDLRRKVLLR